MASAVDSRLAYARLSAVATASRLPTANRGSNNSYTTSWDTTDLGSRRLSEALLRDSPDAVEKCLRTACESLAAIHRAGRQAGLERQVVALGQTRKWLQKLVATPDRVGRYLNLPAPDLDAEAIVAALSPGEPWFIKWDARPGNAVACNDGRVAWFDWEHCGCRNRLDDLA